MSRKHILILGYGEMGHAIECLLGARHELSIWQRHPSPGQKAVVLDEVVPLVDVVIFCLPVVAHESVAMTLKPYLRPDTICVTIAKGLDESGRTALQIFSAVLDEGQQTACIYGPMISEEIQAGRLAFAQVGSRNADIAQTVISVFAQSGLYLESTDDRVGISWAVILKNIYALAFGMADELELGDNARGYLAVTALRELDAIIQDMGARESCAYNLAGLGDLITTATSEDSHHHELGRMLARGETENIRGEGVHTLEMVGKFHIIDVECYPLMRFVRSAVHDPKNIAEKFSALVVEAYSGKYSRK